MKFVGTRAAGALGKLGVCGLLAFATACGSVAGNEEVEPRIAVTGEALVGSSITAINGTYGALCSNRTGAWSVRVSGSAALTNPVLSVIAGDSTCTLTVTSIEAGSTYNASPSITLGTSYAATASAFAAGVSATAFYANAKISATDFASDFTITVTFANDTNASTATYTGSYATASATVSTVGVGAPNYTVDFTTDGFATSNTLAGLVTVASGKIDLVDGSQTGEGYYVDQGLLAANANYATVDLAYKLAITTAISGSNPKIDASAFGLTGINLGTNPVRTIVVMHKVAGVPAYETIRITFKGP